MASTYMAVSDVPVDIGMSGYSARLPAAVGILMAYSLFIVRLYTFIFKSI